MRAAGARIRTVRLAYRPLPDRKVSPPPLPAGLAAGAGIGLLSGVVGVGGGIFLGPLMVLMGWATTKRVAAVRHIVQCPCTIIFDQKTQKVEEKSIALSVKQKPVSNQSGRPARFFSARSVVDLMRSFLPRRA